MKNDIPDNVLYLCMQVVKMLKNSFQDGMKCSLIFRDPNNKLTTIFLSEDEPVEVLTALTELILFAKGVDDDPDVH